MALKQCRVKNVLRGSREEVIIRFDENNLIGLPCHCRYDPALCTKKGNRVMVVRRVEIKNPDNSWSPYPSMTWLDGIECGGQLVTRVLIKKAKEKRFEVMSSLQGVPDGKLFRAVKEVGIYTETLNG